MADKKTHYFLRPWNSFISRPFEEHKRTLNLLRAFVHSYATMFLPKERSGNLASLRTFRVLRALKTVAVVPGNLSVVQVSLSRTCRNPLGARRTSSATWKKIFSFIVTVAVYSALFPNYFCRSSAYRGVLGSILLGFRSRSFLLPWQRRVSDRDQRRDSCKWWRE